MSRKYLAFFALLFVSACLPTQNSLFEGNADDPGTQSSNGGGEGAGLGGGEPGSISNPFLAPKVIDNGVITPPVRALNCESSETTVLKAGQTSVLSWEAVPNQSANDLSFSVVSDPLGATEVGSITAGDPWSATYQAPLQVPNELTLRVFAQLPGGVEVGEACTIHLIKDGGIGVSDDGHIRGLVGKVYELESGTGELPDFSLMTPVQTIVVPDIDIPTRSFSEGFPDVPDLFEWFGIRFEGRLNAPEDADYQFALLSDDGANLYIDGVKIIDNDGVHAPATMTSWKVTLSKGLHDFRLDYFQGPRYHIALQLFWRPFTNPQSGTWTIVPSSVFERPL